jgi:hypothetical protein
MDINNKLSQADKFLFKMQADTEKELVKAYSLSLKNIRGELQSIYNKFGDDVTYGDMQKFNRLSSLEKQIMAELTSLHKLNAKTLNNSLYDQFATSYLYTGFALETGTQVKLSYNLLNPKVIEASINNPISGLTLSDRLQKNRQDIIYRIRGDITQGLIRGQGYNKTAQTIKSTLESDLSKAIRVVATESHRVQQDGRYQSMQYAESKGIEMVKVWDATLDGKTRDAHQSLDGTKLPMDEDFVSSEGGRGQIPGSMNNATDDVNCRCSIRTEILGYSPEVRKARDDNGDSVLIQYTTYDDWKKNL